MAPRKQPQQTTANPAVHKLAAYVLSGYPVLWVNTLEEHRTVEAIVDWAQNLKLEGGGSKKVYKWELANGWVDFQSGVADAKQNDPAAVLPMFPSKSDDSILLLPDFHFFCHERTPSTIRQFKEMSEELKTKGKTIIIISPKVAIPLELEKMMSIVEFALPTETELYEKVKPMVAKNAKDIAHNINAETLKPARGLTMEECENAVALSLREHQDIKKSVLESEKLQAVKKTHGLELYQRIDVGELGGLENLKTYIRNRKKAFYDDSMPNLRGIILIGCPGVGKSLAAKVIASELDFPLIRLDIGSLKGQMVGQSEERMRQALKQIDAISPCVVWCDELEKAIGGVQSSNKTDGGTTSNMFGYLLTWMQESKTKKYIVGTVNDIGDLLQISSGALVRRFDDIFYVDVPSTKERREILAIMNKRYNTKIELAYAEVMENWTGAEIEKCVIASVYDGFESAMKIIRPIYNSNSANMKTLKKWALDNARVANVLDSEEHPSDGVRSISKEV